MTADGSARDTDVATDPDAEPARFTERTASKTDFGTRAEPVDGLYGYTPDGDPVVPERGQLMRARTNANGQPADALLEPDAAGDLATWTPGNASSKFVDPAGEQIVGVASGLDESASRTTAPETAAPATVDDLQADDRPEETETTTPDDERYSVTMAPMGQVEFDSVPENVVVYDSQWADHLVALGQQDRIVSLGWPDNYYTGYYDELPGVSFDTSGLPGMWDGGLDKEQFYELAGDIHHIDPCRFTSFESGMDRADFEELERNVGPFFANRFSRAHGEPPKWCRASYEYYTLWELLDKFAQVYQVRSRSQALTRVRDEMLDSIYAELPPEADRPEVGLVVYNHDEKSFSPYKLNAPGFGKAHTRPLRARDAFADSDKTYAENYEAAYDLEGMLEIDPDVILHNFDWTNPRERTEAFFALDEHPVGSELTAFKNGRLYATGSALQGPIMNLFQIEISAKQIYPDLFGQPPEPGEVVREDERLFDRQRVADIINGEI